MCHFISGLAFGPKLEARFGRFYTDPAKTDHHSELEEALGLKDRHDDPHWAKWEFTPNEANFSDFDTWNFRLDENRTPSWWTDEHREATIAFAKAELDKIILKSGYHQVLGKRVWLCGDASCDLENSTATLLENSTATLR